MHRHLFVLSPPTHRIYKTILWGTLKKIMAKEVMVKKGGKIHRVGFKTIIKLHKKEIFVLGQVPGAQMGPIHVLIL